MPGVGPLLAALLPQITEAGAGLTARAGVGKAVSSFMRGAPDVIEGIAPGSVSEINRLLGRVPRVAPEAGASFTRGPQSHAKARATPPATSQPSSVGGSLAAFLQGKWNMPGSLAAFNQTMPGQRGDSPPGIAASLAAFQRGIRPPSPPPLPPPQQTLGERVQSLTGAAGVGSAVGGVVGGMGGALGGGIGSAIGSIIAPGIGTAIGGVLGGMLGKLPGTLLKTAEGLKAFSEQTLESSRDLRRFNGQIANAFARLDRQKLILDARTATATGGSTDFLATEVMRLRSAINPISNDLRSVANLVGGTLSGALAMFTAVHDKVSQYLPFIGDVRRAIRKWENEAAMARQRPMIEQLRDIANGEMLPKNRPPEGVRGDWGRKRKRGE